VAWALSAASNTVTIRLTPGGGPFSSQILARSHLTVTRDVNGHPGSRPADGGMVKVAVPPGRRTRLLVRVQGPRPLRRILTVTAPPPLRVAASRRGSGGLLLSLSSPLRRPPGRLCGKDRVSFPASSEVAVASSPDACRTRLRLTAEDGERAVLPVTIPALPEVPLYAFANSAGRAIYITVDDGWTPSRRVLAIMRRARLPVTAFLIEQAAQRDLPYWRAFVKAGGTVGDHTVSHPDLTKLTLGQATAQWGQARRALGRRLGQVPVLGRPPYGAFDRTVQAAAYRGGLRTLVGWSATMDHDQIRSWDDRELEPGEIVLLHWVPGLGHQLTRLLAAIHARHLHPRPLNPASFVGIAPQRHSLDGD
jgi:peptidoglycan/xylan/chitin deacetylase (PgdA/CDA1 family)